MNTLSDIRAQGFTVRAVDSGLYVDPIEELSIVQRSWLSNNKEKLRQQLLEERWQWFVSLATKHGIHPSVAQAEFPACQDRLDVVEPVEHDDKMLHACMATLCADATVRDRQRAYEAGQWVPGGLEIRLIKQGLNNAIY